MTVRIAYIAGLLSNFVLKIRMHLYQNVSESKLMYLLKELRNAVRNVRMSGHSLSCGELNISCPTFTQRMVYIINPVV